ncbi:acetoin utilization deacetylase AcuC-like enzyme [Psychrobacter immobilis]|uniref:Acetoin utilization deacetylase AcuC-like enzyme n=1 Tax=Psychrobacter immobilis TaxID=498 RepID=A0A2V1ZTQ1_PSYIM|nr:histone deacetylase [Psychrobacter immobilis]MDN5560596.1 histone deacetylase [Psychrobacter sp.]PWK08877.1 acetoin utilization deacetylase AcuC-like enzyme [Psychrobacter immobilis]
MLKIAYSDIFRYSVPEKHRFPMQKYTMIPERLLAEGTISTDNFFAPARLSEDEILTTHTADYWYQLKTQTLPRKEARAIGFEMTPELVERGRYIAHGTYECALYAQQYGAAMNVAGGTHHAFADHGEGFCVFNDVCIASNLLLNRGQAQKILVVDLDVHQGNGNASIMAGETRVFVFSMHGAKNYPFRKQVSDLDIELDNDTGDVEYLQLLEATLPRLISDVAPDMIFYQSAVDVLATDKLGKLGLTIEGCKARDEYVLRQAKAAKIPIAIVMGGGYSEDIDDVVEAHCNTFRLAQQIFFNEITK